MRTNISVLGKHSVFKKLEFYKLYDLYGIEIARQKLDIKRGKTATIWLQERDKIESLDIKKLEEKRKAKIKALEKRTGCVYSKETEDDLAKLIFKNRRKCEQKPLNLLTYYSNNGAKTILARDGRLNQENFIPITVNDIKTMLEKQNYRCAISGLTLNETNCSVDHIVPISKGGRHTLDNLQMLEKTVNKMKLDYSDKYFLEILTKVYNHVFKKSR